MKICFQDLKWTTDLCRSFTGSLIFRLMAVLGLTVLFSNATLAAGITAEMNLVGDSLHLEFKGQSQWNYNLDHSEDKAGTAFSIEVPRLNEAAVVALKQVKNAWLNSITVQHDGPDGKDIVVLHTNQKDLEAFDYLTDQPSRLIIDFFKKTNTPKSQTAEQVPAAAAEKVSPKALTKKSAVNAKTNAKNKNQRKPATADALVIADNGDQAANPVAAPAETAATEATTEKTSGIFDGGDPNFDRFAIKDYEIKEESILAAAHDYYIDFPMLRINNQELEKIQAAKPIYEIENKDTEENKQARLLLTLFNNKRYNVFLKAVDWFYQKYPNTEYDEIIKFMWADTHFALWQKDGDLKDFDLAMLRYRQAIEKYPKSPLLERTQMLMGYSTMDRGDYLGTLRLFQKHIATHPQSPNRDLARLAIADAFLHLGKFDETTKMYDEIEQQAAAKKYQVEAAYLKGDVEFQKRDYAKAIEVYQQAEKKFPEGVSEYPNALYNQAAAFFLQKNPKASLTTYLRFLKKFPNHSYAGYAMTRVGELLQILGADKTRVIGAYLETYFRYGDGQSSIVARLHLLANRMGAMKEKDADKAVGEIMDLARKSKLDKIDQFATVLIAEGYAGRKEFDKSMNLLTKYYQQNPTTADTKLLSERIVRDINDKLRMQVDSGDFIHALETHNQYAGNWLKNSERIDTKYQVARAFEQGGALKESAKLYRDTLNRLLAIRGTADEKERRVNEHLPTLDQLNLRLAIVESNLGNNVQAYDLMKEIHAPEQMDENEQLERVRLAANLLEKKGDIPTAIRYLSELLKTWKGIPELEAEPFLQLAELEVKNNQNEEAIRSLQKVDQLMQDSAGKVSANVHEKSLERLGDLQIQTNHLDDAMKTYATLLEKYESKFPLSSIRYRLGKMYFKKGEMAKASDTWNALKNDKNPVWYNLAQEQIKNSDWNNDYKKYIKRIPAMSNE